ncbi:TonB-dependent receptor [Pelagicoccus sp. SDUM812003]|uniref:TonB-dependent receptor plug domain-containing protein n=1 Tax=Pelagicoccus sp. SDUM812003 TaxID=3041267 RepID=UPI00280C4155|nr:TonB-dependent receptor [Pelagicoccus sp. SDUM812003]MDQ8203140.1 TonB-dependent receptor [Pelagicoccus sp. SDUM812003]
MKPLSNYINRKNSHAALALGIGVASFVAPARSQEEADLGYHELDAVVAVASRMELPIQQVGSSVIVLDDFELGANEATFLSDSLRAIPGFYLRNNGGPGGSFGMTTRGLSGNRPTVLLNGIEVSNPASGQMINLGNLFTGATSRVEILKGAQSSLYGADALAGVIAIDTLSPDMRGARAGIAYGSYDTYEYSLGHSGSSGPLKWSVDGMIYESEGFSAQDPAYGPAWADEDSYDNKALSSALEYNLPNDARVFFSAYYSDAYSEFDPGDPSWVWGEPKSDNYAINETTFAKAGTDFRVNDNWTSVASVAYSNVNYMSVSDDNNAATDDRYFSNGDRYQIEWQNTVQMSENWRFVAGAEHEIEDNRSDVGDRDDTSVFMENVISASEDLDVTLGARYDDNSAYGTETTYRATFSYRIDPVDARLRGSYGTSFQAPSFYQLYNGFYGNPDLNPETGEGWDLGIEKTFVDGRVFLSSSIFGYDITDKINWNGVYQNVGEYQSKGIETSARYHVSEDLRVHASHTYSDAEEGGVEALRVPRNIVSLGGHWIGMDGKLSINADALFVSSQYSSSGGRATGQKNVGYNVVNLAARYELNEQSELWMRIGNLFDEEYQEIAGYQTAGANYKAGVRFKF